MSAHLASTPSGQQGMVNAVPRPDDSFADWIGPHWGPMATLARRLAPDGQWEDVLQDALASAWRKRRQFDPARGSPRTWLLAITADAAAKTARRAWSRPRTAQLDDVHETSDCDPDVDLQRAVRRLPRRQRLAVALFYYVDLPVAEVAAVMACSEGTVKSTLSDARRALRTTLGDNPL